MKILFLLLLCLVPMPMEAGSRARCPLPHRPAHGWVQSRRFGRVASFSCFSPFQLVGHKYTTCGMQGWDHPTPICIRPSVGCPVPSIDYGSVWSNYNDAWLQFFCQPGFRLVGSPDLYCDGTSWNGTIPTCVSEIVEAQLSCNFEQEDLCGWRQDDRHDFDWIRHNKKTPSNYVSTGPSYDHTFGNSGAGYYMYIESSAKRNNDKARLISPMYSANLTQDGCFSLFYHMYGNSIGGLRVYEVPENSRQIVHLSEAEKQDHLLFEKWGNLGDIWFRSVSTLKTTSRNFQIVIEGIRGSSFTSDIAIDDVAILQGDQCRDAFITAVTPPEFKLETCSGRCSLSGPPSPGPDCRCDVECVRDDSCCPDFYDLCVFGYPSSSTSTPSTSTTTTTTTTTTTPRTITTSTTPRAPPPVGSKNETVSTQATERTVVPVATKTTTTTTKSYENITLTAEPTTPSSDSDDASRTHDNEHQTVADETTETTYLENSETPRSTNPVTSTTTTTTTTPRTITSPHTPPTPRVPPPAVLGNGTGPITITQPPSTKPTTTSTSKPTTKPPSTTTKSSTITNLTTKTPVQTPGKSDADKQSESSSFPAVLVSLLVLGICLAAVGLVTLLILCNSKKNNSRHWVPRLFPFRATYEPNSRERDGASEIPILEFGDSLSRDRYEMS